MVVPGFWSPGAAGQYLMELVFSGRPGSPVNLSDVLPHGLPDVRQVRGEAALHEGMAPIGPDQDLLDTCAEQVYLGTGLKEPSLSEQAGRCGSCS